MYSNILFTIFIFLIMITLINFKKKKILILMSLEIMMIFMMVLMFFMNNNNSNNFTPFASFLLIMVTESVLGLTIMTASSRNSSLGSILSNSWF